MGDDEAIRRCDYCRLPIPRAPRTLEFEGDVYEFCSDACREAVQDSDRVFTKYHGHRRFDPGVSVLDASLPQGVPRNSFVMLTDLAGTRTEAVQAELVWRTLQRGEPAVVMAFLETPVSLIQTFATLEWNVLPYLESGQFHVVDCFTYRLSDRERTFERMNAWNKHLTSVAEQSCTRVRDPSEISELESRLDSALEDRGMSDEGIVVIDSLTELGTLVQPVQAYSFVKDLRADVCKGRFVPVFAGATVTSEEAVFPHDLDYMVDGIVEMGLNSDVIENALLKQIRVRKMAGVLIYAEWSVYEYTSGRGMVAFDPVAERERSREAKGDGTEVGESGDDGDAGSATDGENATDGETPTTDETGADSPDATDDEDATPQGATTDGNPTGENENGT